MAPIDKKHKKPKLLVMLDMNGVLILRSTAQVAKLRAHLDIFLDTLWKHYPRIQVAVWSSMMMHNLMPLVEKVFGHRRHELAFVWDQSNCTERHVDWLKKALLRKDMKWFKKTEWAEYYPGRMLLVDDDPVKCTKNPAGSAIHPSTFDGQEDSELLRMARYIDLLASSDTTSVTEYVLAHPFEQFKGEMTRAMVESIGDSRTETRKPSPGEFVREAAEPAQPEMTVEDIQGANMIEIYMPDLDAWLPQAAKDIQELPNGSMRITVEGEEEFVVPAEWVRDLEQQAPKPKGGKKQRVSKDRELSRQPSFLGEGTEEAEAEEEDDAPAKRKAPSWWGMDDDDAPKPVAAQAPPKRTALPANWRKLESRSHPGNYYYYNSETGKSSFDVPQ